MIHFLDSGAHSLYNLYKKKKSTEWHTTKEFYEYVDSYAGFVKKYKKYIHYYANVDVIFNPEASYKVQKYLEQKHGLHPVPVIHCGTDIFWLKKYMEEGYDYIGIGGLGQGISVSAYKQWADSFFSYICPAKNKYRPLIKTHGFAMTGFVLFMRYPWTTVDSASYKKQAGYGFIRVPVKKQNEWILGKPSLFIKCSKKPNKQKNNIRNMSTKKLSIIKDWLLYNEIKTSSNHDLINELEDSYELRVKVNVAYFEALSKYKSKTEDVFKAERNCFFE